MFVFSLQACSMCGTKSWGRENGNNEWKKGKIHRILGSCWWRDLEVYCFLLSLDALLIHYNFNVSIDIIREVKLFSWDLVIKFADNVACLSVSLSWWQRSRFTAVSRCDFDLRQNAQWNVLNVSWRTLFRTKSASRWSVLFNTNASVH